MIDALSVAALTGKPRYQRRPLPGSNGGSEQSPSISRPIASRSRRHLLARVTGRVLAVVHR